MRRNKQRLFILLSLCGGALLVRGDAGITGIRVPAPADPQSLKIGAGWKLTLAEGWAVAADGSGGYRVTRK